MLRSIYFNGRIYEGVTPVWFGRADYWNTESEAEHDEAFEAYMNHIESFPSYPIFDKHTFRNNQTVVDNVDYKLWISDENTESYMKGDIIAISLNRHTE